MQKKGHSLEGVWNLNSRRHRYMDAACGNEIICPLFCQPGLGPCTGDGTMTLGRQRDGLLHRMMLEPEHHPLHVTSPLVHMAP